MTLEEMYEDASLVFENASFASDAGWSGDDLQACLASFRHAPPQGIILFLTGSKERGQGRQFSEWMQDLPGWLMVAPNTHALSRRPAYNSPADPSVYTEIHALRVAEIDYCLKKLRQRPTLADVPVAIVGLSEGAVAALAWRPDIKVPRICLAWPCEPSYFSDLPPLPADQTTPILNIMGGCDHFFGATDSLNAKFRANLGHGANTFSAYENAKIILYPKWGHRVLEHPSARGDVMGFLNQHLKSNQNREC